MYDVLNVADSILKIAKAKEKTLTPMQLVKLVYIAHGWSLARNNRGLFKNRIEAWLYGPVIPDLYHATKIYGKNPIPLDKIGDSEDIMLPEDRELIEKVFNKYGDLSGIRLSYLTHQSGSPWEKMYEPNTYNIKIPNDLIQSHYKEMLDE